LVRRGFASLKLSYLPEILGVFKRGVSPSYYYFPFPLVRGRVHPEGFSLKGIQGIGLLNSLI